MLVDILLLALVVFVTLSALLLLAPIVVYIFQKPIELYIDFIISYWEWTENLHHKVKTYFKK